MFYNNKSNKDSKNSKSNRNKRSYINKNRIKKNNLRKIIINKSKSIIIRKNKWKVNITLMKNRMKSLYKRRKFNSNKKSLNRNSLILDYVDRLIKLCLLMMGTMLKDFLTNLDNKLVIKRIIYSKRL